VRKCGFVLVLYILACIGRDLYDHFSSRNDAFRAYQEEATRLVKSRRHDPTFESVEGYIADVLYRLESLEHEAEDKIRLVAIQAVHFQRSGVINSWVGRKVAKTRQRVLMTRDRGTWRISELEEDLTEVSNLGDAFAEELRTPQP
jgi:hypothetical protein